MAAHKFYRILIENVANGHIQIENLNYETRSLRLGNDFPRYFVISEIGGFMNISIDRIKIRLELSDKYAIDEKIINVLTNENSQIRLSAVKELKSPTQELLAFIFEYENHQSIRSEIVSQLTDQKVLEKIARVNFGGWNDSVRDQAFEKITNPKIRKEIEDEIENSGDQGEYRD